MQTDHYRTIASPSEGLYKEKGSKFLAFAYPIASVDDVKPILDDLRRRYFDARHHCYAYLLGADKATFRAVDDGEPSGTGGRPIHGQMLSKDVTNTLIVVVRYFGGILLGASGLANAYKAAASDALANATIVERTVDATFRLSFDYTLTSDVMRKLKELNLNPTNKQFTDICQLDIHVRLSDADGVAAALSKLHGLSITPLNQ